MVDLKLNIPESFFEEEVRDGYTVSSEAKRLWAVELDLLAELDRVCRKHGITYWALGGTLLGAIRHQGFIPWDDDIDVMMLREDYDRLCEVGDEFCSPYFFQTAYTDEGCLRGHAQLRNSNTTAVLKWELPYMRPFNQGVFIDIFPFDAAPDSQAELMVQAERVERLKQWSYRLCCHSLGYRAESHNLKGRIAHPLMLAANKFKGYMDVYREMERECARHNGEETHDVSQLCMPSIGYWRRVDRSWLEDTEFRDFEFMSIPVPAKFHEMLTSAYGDYMKPVKAPNVHGDVYFDVDTPYRNWLEAHASRRAKRLDA